ncbi:MAG: hypothetical protein ACI4J5_01390 [Oscillospiraceae bacterium]
MKKNKAIIIGAALTATAAAVCGSLTAFAFSAESTVRTADVLTEQTASVSVNALTASSDASEETSGVQSEAADETTVTAAEETYSFQGGQQSAGARQQLFAELPEAPTDEELEVFYEEHDIGGADIVSGTEEPASSDEEAAKEGYSYLGGRQSAAARQQLFAVLPESPTDEELEAFYEENDVGDGYYEDGETDENTSEESYSWCTGKKSYEERHAVYEK